MGKSGGGFDRIVKLNQAIRLLSPAVANGTEIDKRNHSRGV
jgi:hypothetical protein